jgi:streptogramin lyase
MGNGPKGGEAAIAITGKWAILPETGPGHYLRRLTLHRGAIAYTKYIVSKIGAADLASRAMKEYALPPVPWPYYVSSNFSPIDILSIGGNVWLSSQDSGAIARFNPRTRQGAYLRTSNTNVAFVSPRLAKDTANRVWSHCVVKKDIGRPTWPVGVDPGLARIKTSGVTRPQVEYWILPADFITPYGLWTDDADCVWFTVFDASPGRIGPSFGRLDPNTGELTGYYIGAHQSPFMVGIAGTPDADEIWMTGESAYGNSRVYRFQPGTGVLHSYSHAAMKLPNDIILPGPGKPYFTSGDGYVNRVIGGPTAQEAVSKTLWVVRRRTRALMTANFTATTSGAWVAPAYRELSPEIIVGPFQRWPVPAFGPAKPESLLLNDADEILFTDFFAGELGLMADF